MATTVLFNGLNYSIPAFNDTGWAQGNGNLSSYFIALANSTLTPSGGSFPLTSDINFGGSFGLISLYYKSHSSNIASAGVLRLSNTDTIDWRNFNNNGNNVLAINASDQLTYNSAVIGTGGNVSAGTQFQLAYYPVSSNSVSGNPNTMAATQVVVNDANGVPTTSGNGGTTATEIGYVHGVTSAIQTQIDTNAAVWGPIGSSFFYSSVTPPNSNYVLKDGRAISRTTYSALFSLIGTTFGVGDGSTTFNIPDGRNRMPFGAGGAIALGQVGGSMSATLTNANMPASITVTDPGHTHLQNPHNHNITDPSHVHTERVYVSGAGAQHSVGDSPSTAGGTTFTATNPASTDVAVTGITVNNATATNNASTTGITVGGSATPVNTVSPYQAEYWMYRII